MTRSGRRPRAAALAAAALLAGHAAWAAEPAAASGLRLEATVTAPGATVGDRVTVDLRLVLPPAAGLESEPRFPAWRETWGAAEVAAAGEVEVEATTGGGRAWHQRVVLQVFRPGRTTLPPREVAVPLATGTVRLTTPEDLAVEVASVLPPPAEGEDAEEGAIPPPRAAEPPLPLPWGTAFWVTAGAGAALCLAALLLLRRRLRQEPGAAPAVPSAPPIDDLLRALAAARAAASGEEGHAAVSAALRRYLGRRLHFPAVESTTTEIQRHLLGRHLPAGLPRQAVELLRSCDLVKFARRPATGEAVARRAAEAETMGRAVERHLRPPEPAAAPGEVAA